MEIQTIGNQPIAEPSGFPPIRNKVLVDALLDLAMNARLLIENLSTEELTQEVMADVTLWFQGHLEAKDKRIGFMEHITPNWDWRIEEHVIQNPETRLYSVYLTKTQDHRWKLSGAQAARERLRKDLEQKLSEVSE